MLFATFLVDEFSFLFTCLTDSVLVCNEKFDFEKLRGTLVSIGMTGVYLSINCQIKAVCYSLGLPRSFNYWVFLDLKTIASSSGKKFHFFYIFFP